MYISKRANNITVLQGPNGAPSVQGSFGFRVQNSQSRSSPSGEGAERENSAPTGTTAQPSSQQPQSSDSQRQSQSQQRPQQQTQQPAQGPQHQIRNPRVSVFADVIEDLERVQQDLRPHLTTVRQLLRDDPALEPSSVDYRQAQHTYNQVLCFKHFFFKILINESFF